MKSTTPIKRHQAIASFSKDHHFGLLLVWKIRQGLSMNISTERISNYVLYIFNEDLKKHFFEEEQLLFSQLAATDPMRKRAEADHAAVYKMVYAIAENKDQPELLSRLAYELEKHIRFEERELFNHLQGSIGPAELEEIGRRIANSNMEIDEAWPDNFWMIKKQ